ncbi:MAG: hypothetical protein AAF802_01730 [Planctomycetota bacterium]
MKLRLKSVGKIRITCPECEQTIETTFESFEDSFKANAVGTSRLCKLCKGLALEDDEFQHLKSLVRAVIQLQSLGYPTTQSLEFLEIADPQ